MLTPCMTRDFPILARARVSLRWGGVITYQKNCAIFISKEEANKFFIRLQRSRSFCRKRIATKKSKPQSGKKLFV